MPGGNRDSRVAVCELAVSKFIANKRTAEEEEEDSKQDFHPGLDLLVGPGI